MGRRVVPFFCAVVFVTPQTAMANNDFIVAVAAMRALRAKGFALFGSLSDRNTDPSDAILAQLMHVPVVPARAGTQDFDHLPLGPRGRGNDENIRLVNAAAGVRRDGDADRSPYATVAYSAGAGAGSFLPKLGVSVRSTSASGPSLGKFSSQLIPASMSFSHISRGIS